MVLVHLDFSLVVKKDLWIGNLSFYYSYTPPLEYKLLKVSSLYALLLKQYSNNLLVSFSVLSDLDKLLHIISPSQEVSVIILITDERMETLRN